MTSNEPPTDPRPTEAIRAAEGAIVALEALFEALLKHHGVAPMRSSFGEQNRDPLETYAKYIQQLSGHPDNLRIRRGLQELRDELADGTDIESMHASVAALAEHKDLQLVTTLTLQVIEMRNRLIDASQQD